MHRLPARVVAHPGRQRIDLYLSLTEAIIPEQIPPLSEAERVEVVRDTSAFVRGQIDALPPRLLLLVKIGLTGFRVLVRLRYLRSFCGLSLATRRRIVVSWAYGPVPLARQLFRSLRSTALLAFFEHPTVTLKMGILQA
jgi:hypothetical protein